MPRFNVLDAPAWAYTVGIFGPDGTMLATGSLLIDGYFYMTGTVTVPNAPIGQPAEITVKAWQTGKYYGTALLRGSTTFTSLPLGGVIAGNSPVPTPGLTGMQSFIISDLPEPGTITLGAFGVCALLLRRRK